MTIDSTSLEGKIMKNRYKLGRQVDHGSFGAFHIGTDMKTKQQVAIKCEKKKCPLPQLHIEFNNYKILNAGRNVPKFIPKVLYYDEVTNEWDALVMELFGPSLKKMAEMCGGHFSIATTAQVLMQLTTIMEYMHDRKILYRDCKPDNFLIGLPHTDRWNTVIIIDMGFAKPYVDENNQHIPYIEGKALAGTMRFASSNNQQGREICRRDDLEALLYQSVFLFKRDLPWERIAVNCPDPIEQNRIRAQFKETIEPMTLCAGMPRQFSQYLTAVRPNKCAFEERPQYRKLIGLMRDVLTHLGLSIEENFYDWDNTHNPVAPHLRS